MNERIKQLWQQAAESTAAYPSGQNNSWETQVNFLDKFAELIVRECAKVCDDLDIDDWGDKSFDDGTYYCSRAIKEHFGVEE